MKLFIIILVLFETLFSIKNDLLYFQQNSYNTKEHIDWVLHQKKRYFFRIFCLLPIIFNDNKLIFIIIYLLAILNVIERKKSIVKLNITSRVKHLMFTNIVLTVGISAVAYFIEYKYSVELLSIMFIFSPIILLASNIINLPLELIIKQYYINDAKKIMASHSNLIVIGVTGSYGKTSVKNYLGTILGEKYNVLITPKNYNTTMGVVLTIRKYLKSTHEIFICEMGAKYEHDIEKICKIVCPKIGILTGIAPMHLKTFKSIENIIKTKLELTKYAKKIYYNGDSTELKNNIQNKGTRYSLSDVKNIVLSASGTSFIYKKEKLKTSLIGEHNVQNLIASIKVAENEFNFSLLSIKNAINYIKPVEHRQELKEINDNTLLIDDAYNSNPIGSKMALNTLSLYKNKYKVIITPGMIDLGKSQIDENEKFGKNIIKVCDEIILIKNKWVEPIINVINNSDFKNYKYFSSTIEAINYAMKINKDKVILVENDLPDNYF